MNPLNPFGSTPSAHSQQIASRAGHQGTMPRASAFGAPVVTDQERMARLGELARRHELSGGAVCKLRQLEDYDIVVVADDSGSMKNKAHAIPKDDPFALVPTRWEELRLRVSDIIEFATALDKDGIDIYFLNRGRYCNITTPEQARELFREEPGGSTPLLKTYQQVMSDKLTNKETKALILIATDGEPDYKDAFINCLENRKEPHRCPTSIMACTDNENEVGWLNQLDGRAPYMDVLDDYESEKAEVMAAQNNRIRFTKGDYIAKTLLGPIDEIYGNLDGKKLTPKQLALYNGNQ